MPGSVPGDVSNMEYLPPDSCGGTVPVGMGVVLGFVGSSTISASHWASTLLPLSNIRWSRRPRLTRLQSGATAEV